MFLEHIFKWTHDEGTGILGVTSSNVLGLGFFVQQTSPKNKSTLPDWKEEK